MDSTLWEEWLRMDPVAVTMFKFRSRKEKEVHVNRILGAVMGSLDDPVAGKAKLRTLGMLNPEAQLCEYDFQDFQFDHGARF